jgi:predicted O-methyltransferase YrrM
MYSKTKLTLKYLHYYLFSSNGRGHGVHSPFVYEFINEVLIDDRNFYAYLQIENIRQQLLQDRRKLTIEDFGAGSRVFNNNQRTVASIASTSLKPKKYSQLLFRMINHYQPKIILELGTSLGITSSYLAAANPTSQVITMEGSLAIASVAKENFSNLGLENIEVVQGNFDNTLPSVISKLSCIDFAFIDGNHRYEPTVNYFNQMLSKSGNQTIIILDDIHWSTEMEQAWKEVQQHSSVTLTIDLFFIGIVLLKKEIKMKQHFAIRF